MQLGLDFGAGDDLTGIRDTLRRAFGQHPPLLVHSPVGQLVKSMISSRTPDAVSQAAYDRLVAHFAGWPAMAAAPPAQIEAVIADVRWPDSKSVHLGQTLRILGRREQPYDLGFLARQPTGEALAWLKALPGVGPKVAAATLNFSPLSAPALVIDTHVRRVFRRLRLVGPTASFAGAFDSVMPHLGSWTAQDLRELHVLIKHLGQVVCHDSRPNCRGCPLHDRCFGP